ncbi:hypothetical protein D3C80_1922270 [compost metagenome]
MTDEEMPIQCIKRTSVLLHGVFDFVAARLAMVGHALNITAAGAIGLRAKVTTICMHHHAQCIGQLDPVEGIHVHGQVPFAYRGRRDTGQ